MRATNLQEAELLDDVGPCISIQQIDVRSCARSGSLPNCVADDTLGPMNSQRLDSRFLSLVLDVVDQGIFTINKGGNITSFNQAAQRITGYTEEEVIGHQCAEIFRTELCREECPLKQSIHSHDRMQNREVMIQTKDGRNIPISVSTAPLETTSGKLLGGVEVFQDLTPVHGLRRQLEDTYRFDDIISKNEEMRSIFKILPLAAESDSTLLVTGPSGTGKELIARAIHNHGPRRNKPFVAVNCAALPETLLESELFGYRKGAFTDAKQNKPGRIAQAEGGILFLDEVGDIPKSLQVKLLRFLQQREYEPLGSTQSIPSNIRVIAATNRDLAELMAHGIFRDDLYYRLCVLQIELPPLAQRPEDIPLLVRHFINRFRLTSGKSITDITADAMARLMEYRYPGNIRELENIIERAFVLCQDSQISMTHLPSHVVGQGSIRSPATAADSGGLKNQEEQQIRQAIERHRGNRTRAAQDLGIHRSTLLRKLKRYQIP